MVRGLAGLLLTALAMAPGASAGSGQGERLVEVRVHGNYRTPDEEVLRLSGLTLGQPVEATLPETIADLLRRSGRFAAVEVRKRYRALQDASQVALVILVQEHPGAPVGGGPPSPLRRFGDSVMVLPVLDYVDGYGVTAGARVSVVNVLGREGHVIAPLTFGSTRQAGVELDKTLRRGPVRRLRAGGGVVSRENPGLDVRDRRDQLWVAADRPLGKAFSFGGSVSWADVTFGDLDDRVAGYGARVTLDTRANPAFPRNAVYAKAEWCGIDPASGPVVNRYRVEARGYLGLAGLSVLAVRAASDTADGPLPPYEQPLLGGAATLRGFPAGAFVGDHLAAGAVELRVPVSSPMRLGQMGVSVFADAGAAYDHGTRLRDAVFHYGIGAGWYLRAPVVQLGLDVAHGIDRGTRIHVVAGLRF